MKTAQEYLKAAYSRVLIPDEESGTFTANVREFPGCVAQGDTIEEAYANLSLAAESWIEAAQDLGQTIPPPTETPDYSGRVLVRFPRSVHRHAAEAAALDNTSLNQFIVAAVSEKVGAKKAMVALNGGYTLSIRDMQQRSETKTVLYWSGVFPEPTKKPVRLEAHSSPTTERASTSDVSFIGKFESLETV